MMKKICVSWIFLSVCFCLLLFDLQTRTYASDFYSPSSVDSEMATQPSQRCTIYQLLKEHKIQRVYDAYPRELYFGDTLYIAGFIKVVSKEAVLMEEVYLNSTFDPVKLRITSDKLNESYERWLNGAPIANSNEWAEDLRGMNVSVYQPSEKIYCDAYCPEICPLEEYSHPFWTELRTKLTSEGIVCHVEFYKFYDGVMNEDKATYDFDILVKARPVNEMELLCKWYDSTPGGWFSFPWSQQSGGVYKIQLSYNPPKYYEPGLFIRSDYHKPWTPNNPQTLREWCKLESSLIPSTMRDEITMVRFNIELFAVRDDPAARKYVRNKYAEWLNSLPEVQRVVMMLKYEYLYPGEGPSGRELLGVDRDTFSASHFMVPLEK